jgi:hypothetical protein
MDRAIQRSTLYAAIRQLTLGTDSTPR